MHPGADESECSEKLVGSHLIQRMGPLAAIVDASNHVLRFRFNAGTLKIDRIGWKKASVFPGFCRYHDSSVFSDLEQNSFLGTHEQCVLQCYRDMCGELYKKTALVESLRWQKRILDRGRTLDEQINVQLSLEMNIKGQMVSVREIERFADDLREALQSGDYSMLESRVFPFHGDLCVASSGLPHAEFDFTGKRLADLWNVDLEGMPYAYSIQRTESGGAICFVWRRSDAEPRAIVDTFEALDDADKGSVFVQFCFLESENTFFSPTWWNNLSQPLQALLTKYAGTLFTEGGAITPRSDLVGWKFGE